MWAGLGFVVAALVGLALVLPVARRRGPLLDSHPWTLADTAKLHVPVMAGLAGFAITGLVLIAALTRERSIDSSAFDTAIVMFVIAYLYYIGNAFLISFLPTTDDFVPRVHFSLATTIEYRTVFLSWFALHPLLQAYGLERPADVLAVLLPISLVLGSTLVAMATDGLGLLRIKETYLSAAIGRAVALGSAGVVWLFAEGAPTDDSALAMSLVIFAINGLGFACATLTSLAPRYPSVDRFYRTHGRSLVVADTQLTIVALTLLWLAVVGAV
jgi:hypothetical protein